MKTLRSFSFYLSLVFGLVLCSGCAQLRQRSFSFVQMSDPQIGFGEYQTDLAHFKTAVDQINRMKVDLVVICGDLVHNPDAKSIADFKAVAKQLRVPYYCAAGNHDVGNEPTPKSLTGFRRSIGKDYFAFGHKGCRFLVLNTQIWKAPVPGETEKQDAWLASILDSEKGKHRPVFVVQHYPPFLKTADEPDAYFNLPLQKRKELLEAFEGAGVVAILAGHSHTTLANRWKGIQIATAETTSKNFDQRPFGFQVWHVRPGKEPWHEFVPTRQEP